MTGLVETLGQLLWNVAVGAVSLVLLYTYALLAYGAWQLVRDVAGRRKR